jgi:hypothetical protein
MIFLKNILNGGLIFKNFRHSSDENCPLATVNASHFLHYNFFSNSQRDHSAESKFSKNIVK